MNKPVTTASPVLKLPKLAPFLIWFVVSILGRTWRFNVVSPPSVNIFDADAAPKIYSFWHSTLLVVSYLFRNTGKTAIVSKSRDGLIAAGVAARWGHEVAYGSSNWGGAGALRDGVRALRAGRSLGITPDGPKGPAKVAKTGTAQIAILAKTPVVTININTASAWRLKSWDRFIIPYPFAKIDVILSEPIEPFEDGAAGGVNSLSNAANANDTNTDGDRNGRYDALTKIIQDSLT